MTADDPTLDSGYRRPGRPGLSQTQVDRAADALLQQGHRPSVEKVRAAIGGSPNTLAPLLDDWWRRLAARVKVGAGAFERLPGSLAQIAEAFFLHALEEARRIAGQEERRERDALVREQQSVEVRSHLLSLREQELQARLEDRERAVTALELQVRDQTVLLRKLQAAREAAERRVEAFEAERMQTLARVARKATAPRPAARRAAAARKVRGKVARRKPVKPKPKVKPRARR
jgi:hypothetical protein